MKGGYSSDDFKTAFVVAKFPGELEQTLVGLDTAVAKEAFAGTDQAHEGLSQPALRFVIIKVRNVDQLARLLNERLGDRRMGVAERADGDTAAQIEVAFAGNIIDITARPVTEHNVETAITRHHILVKKRLHGGDIIADNGRWRRENFLH